MLGRVGRYAVEVSADGSRSLELPYADRTSALVIVLPPPGQSTRELVAGFKAGGVEARRAGRKVGHVEVRLPRFRVESTSQLNAPLAVMGMRADFSPRANFSGVAAVLPGRDEPICLAAIYQSTALEVTAKGTTAGAITTATAVTLGVEDDPATFLADRPFAFFLIDLRSGLIIFEGVLEDPRR